MPLNSLRLSLLGLWCLMAMSALVQAAQKADDKLEIRGQWQQGGILFGRVPPGTQVVVGERSLRVSPDGDFVFGLGRDAVEELTLTLTYPGASPVERTFAVARRQYDIQHIQGVEQRHVTPPQEVLDRIAEENRRVRRARTLDDDRADFLQDFIWPLSGRITGVYGSQRVYNGEPRAPHFGIDIAGPTGAPVMAPAAGLVTLVEPDLYFSGGTLIIDHGHGLSSTFIHLSKILVKPGERVTQGQVVAEVGATGRATGPHLDWRMNWFEERLDPGLLMADTPMPPKQESSP